MSVKYTSKLPEEKSKLITKTQFCTFEGTSRLPGIEAEILEWMDTVYRLLKIKKLNRSNPEVG